MGFRAVPRLGELLDVTTVGATDITSLAFDSANARWQPKTGEDLAGLQLIADVQLGAPATLISTTWPVTGASVLFDFDAGGVASAAGVVRAQLAVGGVFVTSATYTGTMTIGAGSQNESGAGQPMPYGAFSSAEHMAIQGRIAPPGLAWWSLIAQTSGLIAHGAFRSSAIAMTADVDGLRLVRSAGNWPTGARLTVWALGLG
jgi:hypothetical protein